MNDKLGEIWYRLQLNGINNDAIQLGPLDTPLGKRQFVEIELENPSEEEVILEIINDNKTNFGVNPEKIIIGP